LVRIQSGILDEWYDHTKNPGKRRQSGCGRSLLRTRLLFGEENPCFPGKKQGNLLVAMALEHHCLASSLDFSAP